MKITFKHEIKPGHKLPEAFFINLLLKNRQVKDEKEFLNPTSPLKIQLSDFGFKKEIKNTVELLRRIKEKNEMVIVYTDYDADGITGGAILWETLHLLRFKVMPYVPHRKLEGYGFSLKGIDNVKKLYNPALIISVDHGITAREKVSYAKKLGIPIIVTDHHLKPEKLPDEAFAIFHIPELSGSGVAYIFAKEIFNNFTGKTAQVGQLENNFSTDYLALASIGTIADLVSITGPSRSIVKHGLVAFSHIKRVGLKSVIRESGIEGKKITPYEVGFIIAPRINAVGRLEHAIDALRLLCTNSQEKARQLAGNIGEKNRQRQDLVKQAVEEAKKMVSSLISPKLPKIPKIIILKNKNWHEGIIGLIASKIAEEFYRPTIVLTENEAFLKGSARSIPSFHITDFLRELKEYLIDVGGHKGAAGFTMEKSEFPKFSQKSQKLAEKLISEKDLERKIEVDLKIPISLITLKLTQAMEKLEPFGMGNPRPTFYSGVELIDAKFFGKNNDHLKLIVKDPINNNSSPLELVSFYSADQFPKLARGQKINIVYTLEIDRWGGSERLRGKIQNISI